MEERIERAAAFVSTRAANARRSVPGWIAREERRNRRDTLEAEIAALNAPDLATWKEIQSARPRSRRSHAARRSARAPARNRGGDRAHGERRCSATLPAKLISRRARLSGPRRRRTDRCHAGIATFRVSGTVRQCGAVARQTGRGWNATARTAGAFRCFDLAGAGGPGQSPGAHCPGPARREGGVRALRWETTAWMNCEDRHRRHRMPAYDETVGNGTLVGRGTAGRRGTSSGSRRPEVEMEAAQNQARTEWQDAERLRVGGRGAGSNSCRSLRAPTKASIGGGEADARGTGGGRADHRRASGAARPKTPERM